MNNNFGTVGIDKDGYEVITSAKEGNHNKKVHRLIYENYHKVSILDGVIVHHKNGIRNDNSISNLELMYPQDHHKLHNSGKNSPHYDKIRSLDYCKKLSLSHNSTGYFRVHKRVVKNNKQGFTWVYSYQVKNKAVRITSVSLDKLEEKVKSKGLEWFKLTDEVTA